MKSHSNELKELSLGHSIQKDDIINEYKKNIDCVVEEIISTNGRLVFANVVKKANITNIDVYKYPEIRTYILNIIEFKKQISLIDKKIEDAVKRLKKVKRRITFVALINSCKFNYMDIDINSYIKKRIREVVIENVNYMVK